MFKKIYIIILAVIMLAACSDDSTTSEIDNEIVDGMVLIEAKNVSFEMGSENGFDDEMPLHQVEFSNDFLMDETEVTQAEYDSVMSIAYTDYFTPTWNEAYGLSDEHPAYEINWGDAALYCNALSRFAGLDTVYSYSEISGTPGYLCELIDVDADLTKNGYRLPTEAEWEFACRAGTDTDYFWGKDYDPYPANAADSTEFDQYAIWLGNSWQFGTDDPALVLIRLNPLYQTALDYTIWQEMFTNGAMTGMVHIPKMHSQTPQDLNQENGMLFVVEAGLIMPHF